MICSRNIKGVAAATIEPGEEPGGARSEKQRRHSLITQNLFNHGKHLGFTLCETRIHWRGFKLRKNTFSHFKKITLLNAERTVRKDFLMEDTTVAWTRWWQ